ncbi:MAG: hypothetical protein GY705_25495 [Bacteroidetes bacterium]|nr:hypothetical protein [Bacteroidota bacterium]
MKLIRKWSRILHRDIGYFFIGSSLIYGISGIALNHLGDWNPNYSIDVEYYETDINLQKSAAKLMDNILYLLDEIDSRASYKKHYFPKSDRLKIFLNGGSSVVVNTVSGDVTAEFLRKRPVFYQVNYLHYNPNRWWMWFSDVFAVALIFLALSSFFMVKGKNGIKGRGGIYTLLGIIIPILFLLLLG